MPTYKHPCPYCGQFIDRAVAACPFCGVMEPFSPKRCQNCRRIVEDPAWVVCPGCGQSLVAPVQPVGVPTGTAGAPASGAAPSAAPAGAYGAPPAYGQPTQPAQPATPPSPPPPPPASPLLPMPPAPVQAPAQGPACTGCGAPLPTGARFCTVCGTVAG